MTTEYAQLIQTFVGLTSVLVATAVLYVACRVEKRNQQRFDTQMEEARKVVALQKETSLIVAEAQLKPVLTIYRKGYEDVRGLILANSGQGTGIITSVSISKNGTSKNCVADLVDLGRRVVWDTFVRFKKPIVPLVAGESRRLVELSQLGLKRQGLSKEEILKTMNKLADEIAIIEIRIEYTDVLGNVQQPCEWNIGEVE